MIDGLITLFYAFAGLGGVFLIGVAIAKLEEAAKKEVK